MASNQLPTEADLKAWDAQDPLNWTRKEFEIPNANACGGDIDGEAIYFCGNSLGLLSKRARAHILEELNVWSASAVTGHFDHPHHRPWKHVDEPLTPHLAKLVGAHEDEVAHSSTLTSNLHMLFTTFYRPTEKRWKIVIEKGSFPSDWYAIQSHPQFHMETLGQKKVESAVIALSPRPGEETLRTEDILSVLEDNEDTIAIVWLPAVQYYTGQLFDIPTISKKAHEIGALIGLDMAHGIGNVEIKLDAWKIDFAVWCTYKYLNAGPGAVGGYFIRTGLDDGGRRLAGWWGNDAANRFEMAPTFRPTPGAKGYQHSNTNVLGSIPLLGTLELIEKAGFTNMLAKQAKLTGTLEQLLMASRFYVPNTPSSSPASPSSSSPTVHDKVGFHILTPQAPWRGTQLSLLILPKREGVMPRVFSRLLKQGLVGDERHPSVIRLSPVVLYNTLEEVGKAVKILESALEEEEKFSGLEGVEVQERDVLVKTSM